MILVLNAGSSSLKFAVFRGEVLLQRGQVSPIGVDTDLPSRLDAWDGDGNEVRTSQLTTHNSQLTTHESALKAVLDLVRSSFPDTPLQAVGHRVVHGGVRFRAPVRIDEAVLAELDALVPLAPLHQPHNLAPVRAIRRLAPDLHQVACFDTAFHSTLEPLDQLYALPRELVEQGVRRYGFHGLSYEWIAAQLPSIDKRAAEGRTVVCHLGNGASMCALLAGLSGLSGDMRELLTDRSREAAEAVEYFCYRIGRELGSMAAALEGLDALVFTAGIGEHAAPVRARVVERAAWLGARLDPAANEANRSSIHAPDSAVAVYVIPTNEERMIVRHVTRLVG
jgi:acetate kinase